MAELNTIVPVVIYLSLSFLAALWARKQSQKTSDSHGFIEEYFIGGRSMGGFVLAMSIIASYTSASSFVGGPGVAYKLGLSWVLLAMIQVPTTFLTLGVLGKRFAIMARKTRSVTLTDFLRARYRSDAVVVLCSLALLVFFMAAMLAQFIGGARLFQAVTGYPYIVGLALFGLTVILYTAVGGFRAVVLTDAIQGMVMVFASVVVLVAVVNAGGGMERCVATLKAIDPGLITPTGPGDAVPQPMILSFWVLVGLGILGLPQTSQKCMGYKDSRSMHDAMIMGTLIIGFLLLCVHLAGTLGRAVIPDLPAGDLAMPTLIMKLLSPFWAGVFIAGPLAAIMSTVDSMLLLASAAIIKADVQGSVEAVKQSLTRLSNEEVVVKVIHGGVGAINESDVTLASASNAIIIGFNVRPDATAKSIAEREKVDLRLYRVIYQAIEDVEAAMKGMLDPVFEEKVIGHAVIRQLFKASGVGTIAGSYVLDGKFQRGCSCRITREGEQIYEGPLASLKRFKDDVKEVAAGYECGLVFEKFNDLKEDDVIEAYTMVEVPR